MATAFLFDLIALLNERTIWHMPYAARCGPRRRAKTVAASRAGRGGGGLHPVLPLQEARESMVTPKWVPSRNRFKVSDSPVGVGWVGSAGPLPLRLNCLCLKMAFIF